MWSDSSQRFLITSKVSDVKGPSYRLTDTTDFNTLIGLCVGHDSLFFRYAGAPTTVLAVKDRVTGHNPLAAIYLSETYYRKVNHPELETK